MRKVFTPILLLFVFFAASAQQKKIDSLKSVLGKNATDTVKYEALHQLGALLTLNHPDSAIVFNQQGLVLAKKNHWLKNEAAMYNNIANCYMLMGDNANGLHYYLEALKIREETGDKFYQASINENIGLLYGNNKDYKNAFYYIQQGYKQLQQYTPARQEEGRYNSLKTGLLISLGGINLKLNKPDSAAYYTKAAYQFALNNKDNYRMGYILDNLGDLESAKNNHPAAMNYYSKATRSFKANGNDEGVVETLGNMGEACQQNKQPDSAVYYTQKTVDLALAGHFQRDALEAADSLSHWYEAAHNLPQALKYFKLAAALKDSIYSQDKVKQFLTAAFNEKQRQEELAEQQKAAAFLKTEDSLKFEQKITGAQLRQQQLLSVQQRQSLLLNSQQLTLANQQKDLQHLSFLKTSADLSSNQNKLKAEQKERALANTTVSLQKAEIGAKRTQSYFLYAGIAVLLLGSFFIASNYIRQRNSNKLILQQNGEIATQKKDLETAFEGLKTTQKQLIQSEKMASLGELTAGIAHEIQNPLNFVNNFSDVNREMIDELCGELKNGNLEEAMAIAGDIQENEKKINHHGKRADFIVKGMLEHSRSGSGERQPTNINTLADEFFKLSYQGLRARDKSFHSELTTHFEHGLPKVSVVQQDMGRVLLNLFNNAFYAVNQQAKSAGPGYKPEVSVTTGMQNGQVIIKVKDNGNGIPDDIKEKIMQPFFTTKPTGEGTGLGLSLTYDMVVKGHGGSLSVTSNQGEGSEFTVAIPLTS